jgi:hypothetical protein
MTLAERRPAMDDDLLHIRRLQWALIDDRAKVLAHRAKPADDIEALFANPEARGFWRQEAIVSLQRDQLLPMDFVLTA